MAIPRYQPFSGPALFSSGFRPFFLFGALFAAIAVLFWLPAWFGEITIPTSFDPVDWHIHEMLFGYTTAIMTGFLFTAVPNWTGRMPIQGKGLAVLLALWIAGRIAVSTSLLFGWQFSMVVDSAFLPAVAIIIFREIVTGKNWRNLKVLVPLGLMAFANIWFHLEAANNWNSQVAVRIGFSASALLIAVIGGRIVPSFTRNWLVRENPGQLPASFDKQDSLSLAVLVIGLASWITLPNFIFTGLLLFGSGVAQLLRLSRWVGWRTWRDPLVWILHVGYAFLSFGLIAIGLSILFPDQIPPASGYHLLGIGGIGGMTLAVMVRASLGHTGRTLIANGSTTVVFIAIILATAARTFTEFLPMRHFLFLHLAAIFWLTAFITFVLTIGPMLISERKS